MTEETITKKIFINADAPAVWNVLTNPEMTKKYMFDCEATTDWKPGSPLTWKGKDGKIYVKGTVREVVQQKVLSFTTFDPNSGLKDEPFNYLTATYHLLSQNGHTSLEITDGDFSKVEDKERRFKDSEKGWDMVLPKIKELAEQSK